MSELQGITGAQNAAKILSSKAEDFVNDVSTSYLTVKYGSRITCIY